ncbi:type II toxin-antitoxin system Phd/YefM family antitoxin [Geminicoccus harenae]|uniref:type II toxin-antitoxin system Phd/YefM family antitoxin n=1 Tax=Geminicoccus harenae TaxID=2498453 RepID=UPI00168A401E|nr:type II toxin-antitoxin system prevent-host-death family antitoxin [Geminicoccus harenae]
MRKVSAREANQNFAKLLADVAAGETVVITKRGQEIAKMAPVSSQPRGTEAERQARIDEFIRWLRRGVEFPEAFEFNRDEIYDR